MELTKQIGVLRNRKTLDGRKADRNKVNLEYWNFNENLGDLLAPVVTQWMLHRLGLDLYREAAKPCHLMTIGSVLGLGVFDAVIWGSGVNSFAHVGRVTTQKGYRKLDIRAVRGPVTAQVLRENGYTCPQIYGDPAILLPLIYPGRRPEKKKKYVVIDHYMKRKTTGDDRLSIRTGDYRTFLDKILEAEVVYSSSLHGIILAESYGVPSVFLRQGMEEEMLKYYDWYFATGRYEVRSATSLAEAKETEPMKLPELEELRDGLLQSFPYDRGSARKPEGESVNEKDPKCRQKCDLRRTPEGVSDSGSFYHAHAADPVSGNGISGAEQSVYFHTAILNLAELGVGVHWATVCMLPSRKEKGRDLCSVVIVSQILPPDRSGDLSGRNSAAAVSAIAGENGQYSAGCGFVCIVSAASGSLCHQLLAVCV